MSQPTTQSAPPLALGRDALRVVLFGMPAAGKSSLLGALAEAAQAQEHLLHGRLADLSQGLAELRQRLYDESPRRTVEEIVPYPIAYEPFAEGHGTGGGRVEGMLIDCDGRVANDLLVRRKSLDAHSPEGTLAYEVFRADALILAIDASAPPAQVDADFMEFGRFLRLLERSRGQSAEVGGLPVFLVLTKCDLLAKPSDSALDWMERVEERKRQVDRRFQEFLARQAAEKGALPFGRIDLHLWATAVKRPALAEAPARPREPYAVAELFRQCLQAARDFRRRRQHSSHRLLWTVLGATGLVAALLAVAVGIALHNSGTAQAGDLQNKVESYRFAEGQTAVDRLQGPTRRLEQNIARLSEYRNDPNFTKLPPEAQEFVTGRLTEMQDYLAFYQKVLAARDRLTDLRGVADPQKLPEELEKELPKPRDEWAQTEAARMREDILKDAEALRDGARRARDWYEQLRADGEALWREAPAGSDPGSWDGWKDRVLTLLARADAPPFPPAGHLRGPTSPTWRETVLQVEPVKRAAADWDETRKKLDRLLGLAGALGLASRLPDRHDLLVIEKEKFKLAEAGRRLQDLKQEYPRYEQEFRLSDLPEAAGRGVRLAARRNYDNLLESGREAVLRRLQQAGGGDEETRDRWLAVRGWLRDRPPELNDWRILAQTLRRLADPDAAELDPVTELVAFLGADHFDIKVQRLSVAIPIDLGVRPRGDLTLHHVSGGKETVLTLESFSDQFDQQARVRTYNFRTSGEGTIVYHPGDRLYAQLSLSKGDETWSFTWTKGRSAQYQFEALSRGAYLHKKDQSVKGATYDETWRLVPGGDTRVPTVPDLVPVVKLGG